MNLPHWRIAVWLLGALVLPLILPSDYDRGLLALAAIYALLGLSMNLTFGYLGYISFGHAAFFGLGAYFAALLNMKIGVDFWLAAALAMVPTAALGALIGFASIRIGGVYFAITTLTVAEIFRLLAANWIELTRGPMGIVVPRPTIGILDATGLGFRAYFLMLVILVLGAVVWMISRMLAGAYGRAWLAIRESRDLAEAVGISTLRSRVENIALSGALAGLAGALLVPHVAIVSPDLFSPSNSAMALLIVVLGGVGTLAGPIVGGVLFAWLPEVFRDIGDLRFVAFALLLLIVIRVQPDGIVALFKRIRRALIRQDHVVREAKSAPAAGIATETPAAASAPPSAVTIADSRSVVENADVLLTVERLTKHFRGVEALTDVGFSVRRGEILGLIGPNGAGKTTCMNLVSGFIPPTAGEIQLFGKSMLGLPPHRRAMLGMVRTFQQTTLYGGLSALENVLSGTHRLWPASSWAAIVGTARFREIERNRRQAAEAALKEVGMLHRAHIAAADLPYGEQRLLAVALALAAQPKLLLLDEPAAGLNPAEAMHLGEVLRALRARGLTIVLIEHNLRLVMSVCDRLVVLHHGLKIAEGTVADIQRDPAVVQAYLGGTVAP